jgi:hypothetical protein
MMHQDAVQVRHNCDENHLKVYNETDNCNTEITPIRRIVTEMFVNCQIILRWDMQKFLEFYFDNRKSEIDKRKVWSLSNVIKINLIQIWESISWLWTVIINCKYKVERFLRDMKWYTPMKRPPGIADKRFRHFSLEAVTGSLRMD